MGSKETPIESNRKSAIKHGQDQDTLPATPVPAGLRAMRGDAEQESEASGQTAQAPFPLAQDEIATPASFTTRAAAAPPGDRTVRALRSLRLVTGLCLFISLLSLALSGFLVFSLLKVRQTFNEGLDTAIQAIDSFDGEGFQYEYRFERTIPVSASIPIEQELVFPFEGDIPINTTVEVPIDAGILGTFNIAIPISTSVYVDTSVPVKVDQTFEVSTTIPISMAIPIDVQPDDPAVQDFLGQVRKWLLRLRQPF